MREAETGGRKAAMEAVGVEREVKGGKGVTVATKVTVWTVVLAHMMTPLSIASCPPCDYTRYERADNGRAHLLA